MASLGCCFCPCFSSVTMAAESAVIESIHADRDVSLGVDPSSPFWSASPPVYMENDGFGKNVPAIGPKCARAGPRTISTFYYLSLPRALPEAMRPIPKKKPTSYGIGMLPKSFVGSDFKTSSATKNLKYLRKANGST